MNSILFSTLSTFEKSGAKSFEKSEAKVDKVDKVDKFNFSKLYNIINTMGNSPSNNNNNNNSNTSSNDSNSKKDFENFYEIIDYIATYYILTMDFKSLTKLSQKEYCDNLVILTSNIIDQYFNDIEVTYLAQRIKDGIDINELKKEKINFIQKNQLEKLDIQNDAQKTIKKKRICLGIAKFYIKIAHVFAAIVMTINPVYIYKDQFGNIVKKGLLEKDTIPKGIPRKIYKWNICDERIHSLQEKKDKNKTDNNNINEKMNDNKKEYIHPKICTMNLHKNKIVKNLAEEPGITELMQLYLDDNYDYSNGTFTGMSEETRIQFQKDLALFYKAFTGKENMPPEITKFSDIKLRDFQQEPGCKGIDAVFNNKVEVDNSNELFIKYAKNLKNMIQSATNKQKELLSIINELFSFVNDPYTGKKKIRVNPKLTEVSLQKLIEISRNIIVELYLKCETDYISGIKIYEAIVEAKILETTKKQILSLQKEEERILEKSNQI